MGRPGRLQIKIGSKRFVIPRVRKSRNRAISFLRNSAENVLWKAQHKGGKLAHVADRPEIASVAFPRFAWLLKGDIPCYYKLLSLTSHSVQILWRAAGLYDHTLYLRGTEIADPD